MKNYKLSTLFLLLCVLSTAVYATGKRKDKRPNILFIEVDDLNYEYLSSNGSQVIQTPHVDRLAESGVRFKNAVCQGMMCGPSRNSLMTGLYAHNLGFYNNGEMSSLPKDVWTFPKGLQKAGYYTAWIGKCHIRPYKKGMSKTQAMQLQMGFDFAQVTEGRVVLTRKAKKGKDIEKDWYLSYLKEKGWLEQFMNEYPEISTLPEEAYLDGFFTKNAEAFLANYQSKEPFFLWLNYSVPHGPYDVAKSYHEPFKKEDMPGTTVPDYEVPHNLVKKTKVNANEDFQKQEQAGHCAAVSFMDKQVGKVVDALKANGLFENTIIVFFSDHGVMLGDHQRNHKGTLFRQITNPALIVSYPPQFKTNQVVEAPVELIDLVQTTLEMAKVPESELEQRKSSHSLVPLLTGKASSVREVAYGEIDGYVMATDGHYRLIKGADVSLLFDDVKDPKNLHDIAKDYPEVVKRLSDNIDNWLKETGPVLPKKAL